MMAMYKNWYIGANIETSFHNLWGETLTRDEASHSVVVGYIKELGRGTSNTSNIFSPRYEDPQEPFQSETSYKQMVWSEEPLPRVRRGFPPSTSTSASTARSAEQRIKNSDTDAGIMSGAK